jgi:guanylate kinase
MASLPQDAAYIKPLVICGPSGAGKSTLYNHIKGVYPDRIHFSVSCTTRKPRDGEQDGVHYHFITKETFESKVADGQFLECAEVHGNFYGTMIDEVKKAVANQKICILDIDIQGAKQVRASELACNFLFLLPPAKEVLR